MTDVFKKLLEEGTAGIVFKGSYQKDGKRIWKECELSEELLQQGKWNFVMSLDGDDCEIYFGTWDECQAMMVPIPYDMVGKNMKVITGVKYQ